MSNEDPRPLYNNDPSNTRDAAEKFLELAESAIQKIEAFIREKNNGKSTQTAHNEERLRSAAVALPLGTIRESYEAASSMKADTNEKKVNKRKLLPMLKRYREATVKLDRFLTRKIVGGKRKKPTRKDKKSKHSTRKH